MTKENWMWIAIAAGAALLYSNQAQQMKTQAWAVYPSLAWSGNPTMSWATYWGVPTSIYPSLAVQANGEGSRIPSGNGGGHPGGGGGGGRGKS